MIVRRGFSLVELMVVIVIMGILGAGVMLSSSSAVASARALTIINDLRSLKEAALLFYLLILSLRSPGLKLISRTLTRSRTASIRSSRTLILIYIL